MAPTGRAARLARWLCTLIGGALLGGGLLLWAQAELLFLVKDHVGSTFFLVRWIGKISFVFLAIDQKVPLALADIPDEIVAESGRWAQGLMLLGTAIVVLGLFLRPGKAPRRR